MGNLEIVSGNILNYLGNNNLLVVENILDKYEVVLKKSNLGIDVLYTASPIYEETDTPIEDLLLCYYNVVDKAKEKSYSKIISYSLGIKGHSYKDELVAKKVIKKLNDYIKNSNISFTIVVRNKKIEKMYKNK